MNLISLQFENVIRNTFNSNIQLIFKLRDILTFMFAS